MVAVVLSYYPDDEEHHRSDCRVEPENVGVEEEQPHADGLVDEVLRHVPGAEAYPLEPAQLVEAA